MEKALTGGDDYELLFSVPKEAATKVKILSQRLGISLSKIGIFTQNVNNNLNLINFLDLNKIGIL